MLTKAQVQLTVIYLISIWLEALLYGLYFCLFLWAFSVFIQKDVRKPFASKVFLVGNTMMFLAISLHNSLNLYRLIVAFAYQADVFSPLLFLNDIRNWTSLSSPILLTVVLWIGEALMIYRCFIIWQRNYWAIALPSLLYAGIIGVQLVNLWYFSLQSDFTRLVVRRWPVMRATFPMYLAQNLLTTGLILFKIWSRYRETKATGARSLNTPGLMSVMRIIVESAGIYTASVLMMTVFRALDHPGRVIGHNLLFPMTGIAFVLMAIRVHSVHEEAKQGPLRPSLLPSWILGTLGQPTRTKSQNSDRTETNIISGLQAANSDIALEALDSQHSGGHLSLQSHV